MRQYELMIILDPETDERSLQPTLEKMLTVVGKEGGSVDEIDVMDELGKGESGGRRRGPRRASSGPGRAHRR